MGIFNFKRKDNKNPDIEIGEVPLSTIRRWFLYDSDLVDNKNDLAEALGLNRVSEELEEKEIEESDKRLKQIEPLEIFVGVMGEIAAYSMTALKLSEMMQNGEVDPDDTEALTTYAEEILEDYKEVSYSAVVGTLSIGIDLGIISSETIKSTIKDMDSFNE